jgi:hypothetical protein
VDSLFVILAILSASLGLFCIIFAAYAVRILGQPNPGGVRDEVSLDKIFSIKSRGGAIGFLFCGVLLITLPMVLAFQGRRVAQLKQSVSVLTAQMQTAQSFQPIWAKQAAQTDVITNRLSSLIAASGTLERNTQHTASLAAKAAESLSDMPRKQEIEVLGVEIRKLRDQQNLLSEKQNDFLGRLSATNDSLKIQLEASKHLQAQLGKIEIQNEIEQLVAGALPKEFKPAFWEMIEIPGSKPRKYEVRTTLTEPGTYSVTFDGNTIVLSATVDSKETETKFRNAIPLDKIRDLAKSAGYNLQTSFSLMPKH